MLLDRIKILLKERSMTLAELERKLNFGNGSMSRWNKSTPSGDKIQKVADYFNVSTDYLLGRTDKRHYYDLTEKDKQDIALQAEKLLEGLNSDAETNYYGEPLDDEDKEKLYDAIQLALALTKVKAKKNSLLKISSIGGLWYAFKQILDIRRNRKIICRVWI